uniref:Putative terminase small subunit n=1 Tax=uncultured bacterium Contig643 TaxID=1393602 RepID=W0FM64_9BACT|nr:putative terminase small subunit [uncultured bacterium Contig643]
MTDTERMRRTKAYKKLRDSLIEQLRKSGNDNDVFLDMVEDYMAMYITKEMCKKDVEMRGVTVTSTGSQGQKITKKNDNIDSILKINQQMIKLLDKLGIDPDAGEDPDDDEM